MEIFYEDLMENFNNNNLREKLMHLVNEHKMIIVKGLNKTQRYMIYRQIYYPLKFEKIIVTENDEENTNIKIYNCKIKQKVDQVEQKQRLGDTVQSAAAAHASKMKAIDERVRREDATRRNTDAYRPAKKNFNDSYLTKEDEELTEKTNNENDYVLEDSDNVSEYEDTDNESEYEDSYLTEEDEQLTKLEDITGQILEKVVKTVDKIDRTKSRVNLVIVFNIIGWIMLYSLDPIRLIHIRMTECETS